MNPSSNQERAVATGVRKGDTPAEEPTVHRGPERRQPVIDSYSRVLQALDAGGVGTWEWDIGSGRFSTSATHDRLFGYPAGDSPGTVESSIERVHPDDRALQQAAITQSRDQRMDLRQEFRIVLPNGNERWIQRVGRFVGQSHMLMAGTSVDVTERRASENAVRQTEQQYREALGALYQAERVARAEAERARSDAEIANRAKTEFLAVMSHELRTPLNAIAGYTDLLAFGIRGPVTAEQREDLGRIQRAEQHLLGLINQVLSYARIETGAMGYDLKAVPVLPTIRAVEHSMTPQLAVKEITLQFGGCDPNLAVRADPDPLRQILLNLVGNAVKFTDRGGRILMQARASDDTVDVRVEDTGIGIAPEQLDYIFEPFVQVDPRLTRSEGGVGLGLAISRDLARGMGGDILVTSRMGEGSVFTLRLLRDVIGAG